MKIYAIAFLKPNKHVHTKYVHATDLLAAIAAATKLVPTNFVLYAANPN